jgi:hypothetical protein
MKKTLREISNSKKTISYFTPLDQFMSSSLSSCIGININHNQRNRDRFSLATDIPYQVHQTW